MDKEEKTTLYGRASIDPKGRILEAAKALFFSEGFDRVSVERLANEASVSKTTLYKYFGDMPGVLRSIAVEEADQFDFSIGPDGQTADDLRSRLTELGTGLLTVIDNASKVQFDRLVFEQARHHPDLARVYYEALYARTQTNLAALIERGQATGLFRKRAPADLLADQLLSMWLGLTRVQQILGVDGKPRSSPAERSREAVETLCQ